MFTKTEIELAKPTYEAIKKIARAKRKKWEWKPEVGEWCIDENNIMLIAEVDYITDDPENWYQIANGSYNWCTGSMYVIPLLHWEKLEKIMEGLGCELDLKDFRGSYSYFSARFWQNGVYATIPEIGKTRQEAVMRAIIKLGEETKKIDTKNKER